MMLSVYTLLVLTVVLPELLCVHPLHKLVEDYDTIHKDDVLHTWKRLPTSIEPVRVVKLLLWKQVLELHVNRNPDLFHPMAVAMEIDESGNSKQHPINAHQFYTGRIGDDNMSHVKLHIASSGILTASIATGSDVIYIEPASRFSKDLLANERMFVYNRSKIIPKEINHKSRQFFCNHDSGVGVTETFDNQLRRIKRTTSTVASSNSGGRVCLIHLIADYLFFASWGGRTISSTIIYLANLVETADYVFSNTVWSPGLKNYGLQVGNITIYSSAGCVSYNQPTSPAGRKWAPDSLLEEFSYNDWGQYCLAHLFTNRNFENSTLGYAYVARANPTSQGGICSRYMSSIPDPSRLGTANVGLSSFTNLFGRQLLQSEAEHIFTHEVGHNWGSNHDLDNAECNPPFGKNGGKYIMYASVLTGNDPNNKKFSNCSRRWISAVLQSRSTCFKQRSQSLCGNYYVDPGEQCDVGITNFDPCDAGVSKTEDDCCHDNCTFKYEAVCSDKNQACCEGCRPVAANIRLCAVQSDIECLERVYCNGVSPECPPAVAKPNGSDCLDRGQCFVNASGSATCLTYCEHMFNMSPCICASAPQNSKECYFCCRNGSQGECRVVQPEIQLPNGKPCEGGVCIQGTCNLRSKDLSTRLYDFLRSLSSDELGTVIHDNVVAAVMVITLIPYVAASIVVCCLDRYTERNYSEFFKHLHYVKWLQQKRKKDTTGSDDVTDHHPALDNGNDNDDETNDHSALLQQ